MRKPAKSFESLEMERTAPRRWSQWIQTPELLDPAMAMAGFGFGTKKVSKDWLQKHMMHRSRRLCFRRAAVLLPARRMTNVSRYGSLMWIVQSPNFPFGVRL